MKYSYIEFVGIPGAGKTSIAKEVSKLLQTDGFQSETRQDFFNQKHKRSYKVLWSLFNLNSVRFDSIRLIWKLSRKRNSGLEKLFTRIHEQQKLEYKIKHIKKEELIVWDGGFVQRFTNLVKFKISPKDKIVKFVSQHLSKQNTLFVLVNVSESEALNRIYKREEDLLSKIDYGNKKQPSFKDKDLLISELKQTRLAQKSVFDSLVEEGFSTIIVDGHKTVLENAQIIADVIKK